MILNRARSTRKKVLIIPLRNLKDTVVKRVAIIGSGVSACACGVALREKGIDFTIFEKETLPGGKLLTEELDGFLVEGGPDSFLPEKYWTVDLIKKVGLEDELLCTNDEFKGTYIYSGGRLHRLPEGVMLMVPTMIMPLLKSSLISWPGKIRMGFEFFLPPKKDATDESLAQFVTRRLGKECLEKIAEPLVAGIHTSNPDNMSILAIFPRFVDMERKYGSLIKGMLAALKKVPPPDPSKKKMTYFMSLKRGMQQLTDTCIALIGKERIKTGTQINKVLKARNGYRLLLNGRNGQGELFGKPGELFDEVVLTTPAYVTSELVRDMDSELSEATPRHGLVFNRHRLHCIQEGRHQGEVARLWFYCAEGRGQAHQCNKLEFHQVVFPRT